MAGNQISPDVLNETFRYDPVTGRLFWRHKFNGREAFTPTTKIGYKLGSLGHVRMYAHRAIWAMQTGEWPKSDIDHINRDRSDNRWENLRAATRTENCRNASFRIGCKSKYKGVSQYRHTPKWRARIVVNKKVTYLGVFGCEVAAALAYDAAAIKAFGGRHYGNFVAGGQYGSAV